MNSITLLGDTQVCRRLRSDFSDVRPRAAIWIALVQIVAWLTGGDSVRDRSSFGNWLAVSRLPEVAAYGEPTTSPWGQRRSLDCFCPAIFAAVLFGPSRPWWSSEPRLCPSLSRFPGGSVTSGTRALTGALAAGSVAVVGSIASAGTRPNRCCCGSRRLGRGGERHDLRCRDFLAARDRELEGRRCRLASGDRSVGAVLRLRSCGPRVVLPEHLAMDTAALLRAGSGELSGGSCFIRSSVG